MGTQVLVPTRMIFPERSSQVAKTAEPNETGFSGWVRYKVWSEWWHKENTRTTKKNTSNMNKQKDTAWDISQTSNHIIVLSAATGVKGKLVREIWQWFYTRCPALLTQFGLEPSASKLHGSRTKFWTLSYHSPLEAVILSLHSPNELNNYLRLRCIHRYAWLRHVV